MHVVKVETIDAYVSSATAARARDARAWLAITKAASWAGPRDVQVDFPGATSNDGVWTFTLLPSGVVVTAAIVFTSGSGVVVVQGVT